MIGKQTGRQHADQVIPVERIVKEPRSMFYPKIIQGGMGVAVSNYQLAKTVSQSGQLGVVSGTMIDTILARRLQDGDKLGHFRRAIEQFPIKKISQQVLNSYFIEGGKAEHEPYKAVP